MVPKIPTMTTDNQYAHGVYRPRVSWTASAPTNPANPASTATTGLIASTR